MNRWALRFAVLCLVAGALAGGPALSGGDGQHEGDGHEEREHEVDEHERRDALREAVEHGEAKPLIEVVEIVRAHHKGEIVGVEVKRETSGWIYDVRVADPEGRLVDVYVDAATGRILKTEEK